MSLAASKSTGRVLIVSVVDCNLLQVDAGKVLIFANTKDACEELAKTLGESFRGRNMPMLALHGDKQQVTRSEILKKYKVRLVSSAQKCPIVIELVLSLLQLLFL